MKFMRRLLSIAAVGAILSPGIPTYADTVAVTKSGGDFVAGSGIPADGFTTDTAGTGEQVALKARGRPGTTHSGIPLNQVGSTYYVAPGEDSPGSGVSWWNFDFQFSPRDGADDSEAYILILEIDTDPAPGNADGLFDITLPAPVIGGWSVSDGFHVNPGGGGWNTDTVPYVVSQSWRMDFGFLGGEILGKGEYVFQLSAFAGEATTPSGPEPLARTEMTVNVVPVPAAAWVATPLLAGIAGIQTIRRRRMA